MSQTGIQGSGTERLYPFGRFPTETLENDKDVFVDGFDIDVHNVFGSLGFYDIDLDELKNYIDFW